VEFLQDSGNLSSQLIDSQWLLCLAFIAELTAKLNELNTELQGGNETTFKIVTPLNLSEENGSYIRLS
jgi:hypothetical protein